MPKRIHLDTDIGGDIDDLCALTMLLGWPGVELTGVTTCAEIQGLRAACATYVLKLAGREAVPVAAGAAGSLAGFRDQPELANLARYWPEPLRPREDPPSAALDLLATSSASGATIVAIGPLTNLALLETSRPGLLAHTEVVVMGGYLTPPRAGLPAWGPNMDYNLQADVVAARLVFERCRPVLVPLPVCLEVTLREAHLPALLASGSLGELIAAQALLYGTEFQMQTLGRQHAALPDDLLNFQYDPLACAVAAGWDGVRIEELPLALWLEDGWLRFGVETGGKATRVVAAVDAERFTTDWLAAVGRTGRALTP